MAWPPHPKALWLFLGLAAALALAGCESPGLSGRDAELERLRGERGFAVLEQGADRAVFAVKGREVAVEPPEGFCLDEESIAVSRRSAFALVSDCMHRTGTALANGGNAETLPRAFPGILTVAVSGEAAFAEEPGALPAFETLLESGTGGALLGRGEDTAPGEIVTMRRVDGALYVLIEERKSEGSESIFAPRFWRAFTEVNGRLVLVTVSCFNDRPLEEGEMLGFLAAQISELRAANGQPAGDARGIASAVMAGLDGDGAAAPEPAPAPRTVGQAGTAPARAPAAPRRPG